MIKYAEGEMLDLVPDAFAQDPDWIAFSYALKMAMARALQFMKRTPVYAALDELPEEILDYLALECRCPFYDESWSPAKKRQAIRETKEWQQKAGTPAAVKKLVDLAFGESRVISWEDFAGEPGTPGEFDVEITADITMTPEMYAQFEKSIENVKALTAHLRNVTVNRPVMVDRYAGAAVDSGIRSVVVSRERL